MHDPHNRTTGTIRPAQRPNTLGLGGAQFEQTLDLLDQRAASERGPSQRDFVRWPFRKATVPVTVTHPGGSTVCLRLACRNLSRGGISLLHSGFLHPSSRCRVAIPALDGSDVLVSGVIRRVGHRAASLHEIGIKFDEPIDIRRFLVQGDRNLLTYERVDPETLSGRVVYLPGSAIDARIVVHYCRATRLAIDLVEDCAAAADAIAAGAREDSAVSLAIIETPQGDTEPSTLLRSLREHDAGLPVLMITSDPVGLRRANVLYSSTQMILVKPVTQDQVLRTVAELLLNARIARHAEHLAA